MTPPMTPARARRAVLASTVATAVAVTVAPAASADPTPDFQVPFACGQQWYASTRSGHSPSYWSVDFNRDGDLGSPVVASTGGVVTSRVDLGNSSYGLYVIVDHGGGWSTLYAHLKRAYVVAGERLDEGQVIGLLGTSGNSTGPHLHFEERRDRADQAVVFDGAPLSYGSWITSHACVDVPTAGDWNGDGRSDLGVFRRTGKRGVFVERRNATRRVRVKVGKSFEMPVVGDWNGNGTDDPGTYSQRRRVFRLKPTSAAATEVRLGGRGSLPVAGDWNGDGRTEVGIWNPAQHLFRLRGPRGGITSYTLGSDGDLPVTGDWDGNGRAEIGVYDPDTARFTLRLANGRLRTRTLGTPGQMPVTGDFNGDRRTDVGVWNPSTGRFTLGVKRLDGTAFGRRRSNRGARAAEASANREAPQQVSVIHTD